MNVLYVHTIHWYQIVWIRKIDLCCLSQYITINLTNARNCTSVTNLYKIVKQYKCFWFEYISVMIWYYCKYCERLHWNFASFLFQRTIIDNIKQYLERTQIHVNFRLTFLLITATRAAVTKATSIRHKTIYTFCNFAK